MLKLLNNFILVTGKVIYSLQILFVTASPKNVLFRHSPLLQMYNDYNNIALNAQKMYSGKIFFNI